MCFGWGPSSRGRPAAAAHTRTHKHRPHRATGERRKRGQQPHSPVDQSIKAVPVAEATLTLFFSSSLGSQSVSQREGPCHQGGSERQEELPRARRREVRPVEQHQPQEHGPHLRRGRGGAMPKRHGDGLVDVKPRAPPQHGARVGERLVRESPMAHAVPRGAHTATRQRGAEVLYNAGVHDDGPALDALEEGLGRGVGSATRIARVASGPRRERERRRRRWTRT